MNVKKETLKRALEVTKPAVSSKEMIEQTTSFAFVEGVVITYNDEICISHPIPELKKITGAVRAQEVYALLSKLKEDELEISVEKNELHLKSGRTKVWLTMHEEIKLPLEEVLERSDWKPLPEEFCQAIEFCLPACSNDMSRPILTCVALTKSFVVASDGFRIAKYMVKKLPVMSLIPAKSADQVIKTKPTYVSQGNGWIHFKNAEETIISCRVFEEQFPSIEALMEIADGEEFEFPKSVSSILERAGVVAKRDSWIDEQVLIEIKQKRLFVKSENDVCRFEEEANLRYTGDPKAFSITPRLLQSILTKTNHCILGSGKVKFSGENWDYMALLRNL